jgi:hypothetical protein
MKYFKLYHYSPCDSLSDIDPTYYVTGVAHFSELRRRPGHTTHYSFYYFIDQPEQVVVDYGSHKYEIYMPYEWKKLIYNINEDPDKFFQQADVQVEKKCYNRIFRLIDTVLVLAKAHGYKGWQSSSGTHSAIMLFEKMSVTKPERCQVYHFIDETLIESNVAINIAPQLLFFKNVISEEEKSREASARCDWAERSSAHMTLRI